MAAGSGRASVPVPVVAIAGVLLLLFVGWLGFHFLGNQPADYTHTEASEKQTDYLKDLAKKSGGDFSKLTPEEQEKVNKMTGGHGAQALMMYK